MTDMTLTWDCHKCGAKNLQGDVCPFCGTFNNDAPKKNRNNGGSNVDWNTSFRGASQDAAAADYSTGYREFTSVGSASYTEAPITTDTFTGAPAAPIPAYNPTVPPITTDNFFASGKKPFLFNKANEGIVEGRSRHIVRTWSLYFVLGFFALFMGVMTGVTYPNFQLVTDLDARGREAEGTITSKRTTTSSGRNRSTTYYLKFDYRVGGQRYTTEQSVASRIYNVNSQGSKVTVRYVPDTPARARLGGDDIDDDGVRTGFYLVIVGWTGFAILCVLALNHMMKNARLSAQGQLVTGRIVGAQLSRSKNSYTLNLTYAFTSPSSGKTIQRKESTNRNDLKNNGAPAYGLPVQVLYVDDRTYRVM
jgi:hypothetical protein